jgi:hypothetical protein
MLGVIVQGRSHTPPARLPSFDSAAWRDWRWPKLSCDGWRTALSMRSGVGRSRHLVASGFRVGRAAASDWPARVPLCLHLRRDQTRRGQHTSGVQESNEKTPANHARSSVGNMQRAMTRHTSNIPDDIRVERSVGRSGGCAGDWTAAGHIISQSCFYGYNPCLRCVPDRQGDLRNAAAAGKLGLRRVETLSDPLLQPGARKKRVGAEEATRSTGCGLCDAR